MKYYHRIFLLLLITTVSCKNENKETNKERSNAVLPFTQQATIANNSNASEVTSGNHNLFSKNTPAQASVVSGNNNPAHGAANHRCDIAVGAPLDAVPNPTAPNPTSKHEVVLAETKPSKADGINPAHGQKNHRCDIAVGAPLGSLSSKVVASPTQTVGSVSKQINVTQAVPSVLATNTSTTAISAENNPAHGQKNHRCDLAVGAPLPKN
ncbi:hypothetical protein [Flavobacterium crassostreae]|uniref:Uncharacterized protein n=1 Tax=Flavobacterium crassostreae TaxID=1763534 RepID=A0A1B9DZP2_9FLAO|nr:hypothetical protein [Flavobacterium crassostreae]OCB75149.1 hypothetical protein LPBF_08805 [Flavobacterium crassostreae]